MSDVAAAAPADTSAAATPASAASAASTASASTPAAATGLQAPGNLVADTPADGAPAAAAKPDGSDAADAGANKPADKPADKPAEAPNDKPVEYTDFALPEGVEVDQKVMDSFKQIAAEAKVPQEAAQKLVDLYSSQVKEAVERPYKLWVDTQKEWQDQVKSDSELGGKNFENTTSTIAKAINAIGGEQAKAIREAFSFTGAGNNPEIIRLVYRMAKAVTEGGAVNGSKPAGVNTKSPAETLYPNQGNTNS
ncbi:hypothetical protein [Paraburkholderia kururiensis]|uniref:hypothetical protein n=1 Tax=Paraburkholderia kururiensis TaxID=984307 RepID=UPI00034AF6B0|nr:hypothetical protein [Paraburkholderia kururiensis]